MENNLIVLKKEDAVKLADVLLKHQDWAFSDEGFEYWNNMYKRLKNIHEYQFDVDETIGHRIIVEAETQDEAIEKFNDYYYEGYGEVISHSKDTTGNEVIDITRCD